MPVPPGFGTGRPQPGSTGGRIPLPNFKNPPNFGLNPNAPGNQGGSGSGSSGGSDWQHLLIRMGEFLIGTLLVVVGVNAMIIRSKPGQTVIQTAGTVAKVAAK